ncbi:unnamed protein product [Rotaria sordida]|uniref:JmjC domain-containing protein n=1 Tax=Rotaria sordida TaxID=392033 RepID=A0A818KP36_9BILA|nr:unnamed protein product [Rotaria sordida]CAF1019672.1 unnamed protein product [Rotaria sordida]CAF1190986.1 unnamed protein product [Rotaria sordida]CAF1397197.1 unnamed protein product [Rotaria sordida]CAF3558410.1 unnamed protein product [Rotaria sordida]
MHPTKPPIDIIRIDKRLLTNEHISIKTKQIKLEPISSYSIEKNLNDIQKIIKQTSPPSSVSYLPDGRIPTPPPQPPKHSSINLKPTTPTIILETHDEAMSAKLQHYCLSQSICVLRGLANVLKIDLSLFSTKSLVETQPDHQIEVRTQRQQASDENFDFTSMTIPLKNIWRCESSRSYTTIAKYGQYQAYSYHDMIKDDLNESLISSTNNLTNGISKKNSTSSIRTIKFGTNVDLSDEKKWPIQLHELTKLPLFLCVQSVGNLLSHIGYTILGMNSVQLYMKVPGSRTPGHQENNNFCAINVNIGPGDCEWFAVEEQYWGVIHTLCEKNGLDFLTGSWWPILDDLYNAHVPVYRFIQKPGDLVFVNAGCVHWVQAIGWCNNIAWNVGPLTYTQYYAAIERYEWNKLNSCKSIVPMIHLTWNIARNIRVNNYQLYELIKFILSQSLKYIELTFKYLEEKFGENIIIRKQLRTINEPAHYCITCDHEVFNILFVKEIDRKHVVRCLDCSLQSDKQLENVVVLYQFILDDLKTIYDQFQLCCVANIK